MSKTLQALLCVLLLLVMASAAPGAITSSALARTANEARHVHQHDASKTKKARRSRCVRPRHGRMRTRRGTSKRCPRESRRAGRLFAPASAWNAKLPADAPLDARTGRLAAALQQEVRREVAANYGPWINFDKYSVPVYTVRAKAPTVRVQLDAHAPALQRDFEAVPIPTGAREAAGGDGHLTVYQPATDTLWELWLARRGQDGWHARWGGRMQHVSSNPGYFPDPYGASGTSLPLLGGLMTIDELKAGRIDHALAISVPNTAAGQVTWPAQRGDGKTVGPKGIPEGTRFRIDPSVDLSRLNLTPLALAMARAAQKYGMIVRDTGGCVAFYGEDPVVTPGDPYGQIFGGGYPNKLLRGFPWDRLQVIAPPGR